MIATRRGLAVLGAIALVLLVLLVVDLRRAPEATDRALAPGLDAASVRGVRWQHAGREDTAIIHVDSTIHAAQPWRFATGQPVEPQTIADLFAAVRGARWHRRAETAAAGAITGSITLTGATSVTLGIGAELTGTEQQWLVRDGQALLVDRWVVRALDPDPLALRIRRPLAEVAAADQLQITDGARTLALHGRPRHVADPPLLLAGGVADRLTQALAALELVAIAPGPARRDGGLAIEADGVTTLLAPGCGDPQHWWITSPSGEGCVADAQVRELRAALDAALAGPEAAIERRPAPIAPTTITLVDGSVLDLTGRPRIGDREADPVRVDELLAVLRTPVAPAAWTVASTALPALHVVDRAGVHIVLELGTGSVHRTGEPLALRVTSEASAILARGAAAYRAPLLWLEEPLTISAFELDGQAHLRTGADFGNPAADALVTLLSAPRAIAWDLPSFTPRHRMTITMTPPVGAPVVRTLELGRANATGCPVRFENTIAVLSASVCTLVDKLAR